ncbi:MAG: sulfite exporter TauE/SafE family protein [Woeseiaceae bacterium]|nr:sulfite exporter TauE/SafE family protein [Woeseiaceae bacterium]
MDFTLYWFMFPVAIGVATCAMLSGIGGAALFTPIFILVFPLLGPEYVLQSTLAAIGTALITQTFGFLSGFVGYFRRRLIDYELAWRMLRISVPAALIGALTAGFVHDGVLIASYAALVFVLAGALWLHRVQVIDDGDEPADGNVRVIIDSRGRMHRYSIPALGSGNVALTGAGGFLTGLVSVGIGEVTIAQLTRRHVPIAVAAATSVLVVIVTVVVASTTLAAQMVRDGGWTAIPWNLLVYDIPGVLIGGQIGPRLQGYVSQHAMQRGIAVLFVILALAMLSVALRRFGLL